MKGPSARELERLPRPDLPVRLTENALRVLRQRYLREDESPEELFWRVALSTALAEQAHGADPRSIAALAERFYRALTSLDFLPNSPALMNAGRRPGQRFACFVLPVADAIIDDLGEGIFDTLRSAAFIHQTGGGTGFDFSRLRPEGSPVSSARGRASGPLSFMRVFNAATGAVHQGGFRRGANMGILRVDHPDILAFVNAKAVPGELDNFNLSVAVTDDFLRAVRDNREHLVTEPHTGRTLPLSGWTARRLLDLIVRRAWESGEPGLFFLDRANRFNPVPELGRIEACNPCGEQALLPWEACNLASINLARFVDPSAGIRWDALGKTVALVVRFLDDSIDVNVHPAPQTEKIVSGNRRIGLGIMGWADLLFQLGVRYDSGEALKMAGNVMRFIREESWKASADLARERGPFPNYPLSAWTRKHPYFSFPHPLRNATVTTVAPTGTVSILAGCSAGIEPLFSLAFVRRVLDGERLLEIHPHFREVAEREGFASSALYERLLHEGSCRAIPEIPPRWREIFACAHDVSPEGHVRMQAAFQEHVDSGVSKTVNLPHEASVEDVRRVFNLADELGLRGLTVYRDRSRQGQPMALERARCPDCGGPLRFEEGCAHCSCGFSRCGE